MPSPLDAFTGCVAHAGSQRALAAQLAALTGETLHEVNVSQWLRALRAGNERAIPEKWCEPIETLTERKYRVEELRPDILWKRDPDGRVISVITPIQPTALRPAKQASRRRAKA